MKRIRALTSEQIARMPEWVEKWVQIGLSTERADFEKAEQAVLACYQVAGITRPQVILRMGSPYAATIGGALGVLVLRGDPVNSQVERQVWNRVERQVGNRVESQVRWQVKSQVGSAWAQYRGCQLWAGWYAYITYLRDVCGWENDTLRTFAWDEHLALSCGWTWWHDNVCAISDRPETLVRNDRGQLHCGTGPAIRYPDGWSIWAWNGVCVTEQIIMAPHTLTPEQIATEPNAQIRQVMVERVGHERVAQMFQAKICDKKSITIGETVHPYELLDCVVGETRVKYLKMVNPSMGVYHIEPVGTAPHTVDEALRARQPQWMQQIPIDETNGLAWYQQGDVYIVPDGARSIRKYPATLT